jgi:hypothetical protein
MSPSYVSKDGIWYPAKEHVVLPHLTGTKNEVYDGPDRAAENELALAYGVDADGKPNVTTFGIDFRDDPDLIERARQLGYNDKVDDKGNVTMSAVEQYARKRGWTPEKSEKVFKEKAAEIVKHRDPDRKPEPLILGGGQSTAPGTESLVGGLGDQREVTVTQFQREQQKKL